MLRFGIPAAVLCLLAPFWLIAQRPQGDDVYRQRCASCHDSAAPRVPQRDALRQLTSARILRVLDFGTMMSVGYLLNRAEKEAVADYLGRPGDAVAAPAESAYCEDRSVSFGRSGEARWNGWSASPGNTRFQDAAGAGLTADQARNLELKWAYGFDGDTIAFSQPAVIGGNVFVGSASGQISALDAATGCTKWVSQVRGPVRAAPVMAPNGDGQALLFGDQIGWFYKMDAASGRVLWQVQPDRHDGTRLTGAAVVRDGVAYVPVASWEETRSRNQSYQCCTFRGSVAAIRILDGETLWKTYMVEQRARPRGENADSARVWGPSGAGVWSAPTIDEKRGLLYVTTGDNYSEPATERSDAVVALRISDGSVVWSRQTTPGDVFNLYCTARGDCPGPDHDFGSSALLVTTGDGRDLVLAGQKSGVVYALDPDNNGEIVWQTRVGEGGVNGGVQWGMAADARNVYAATSDVGRNRAPNPDPADPRPMPLDRAQGGGLSALRLSDGERVWYADPPVCGENAPAGCSPAQSAAVTAIPGVVFSGALDGHLRAYSTEDGSVIWDFDTVRSYDTVNGVAAAGGALDGPGAVVADGMVFVNSGYARSGGMAGNVLLAFGPAG